MPCLHPSPRAPRLSRRALLATGGALLAAGCTVGGDKVAPGSRPKPEVEADVAVAADALGEQQRMLDLLRATRRRHAHVAGRLLDSALSAHEEHTALLREAVPADVATGSATSSPSPGPAVSSSPSTTPSSTTSPDARAPAVPRRPLRALEEVVRAEERLGAAMKQHAFRAESGAFARVLGSMAASSTQHAYVLRAALARGGDR